MLIKQKQVVQNQTCLAICAVIMLAIGVGSAHAELTIYQVENNPPGTGSGNEWLTLINTGPADTFSGYEIRTTHGRIGYHEVPTIMLNECEYYKITFRIQTIDNRDDAVQLLKGGAVIYETPVIKDTANNARFWTNQNVTDTCASPVTGEQEPVEVTVVPSNVTTTDQGIVELEMLSLNVTTTDQRIAELEAENARLRAIIVDLQTKIQGIIDILNSFLPK